MLADEFAGLEEVAAVLGRSPGWLMRNWLKIHRELGFPRKHPTGWTWPATAIAVWARASARPQHQTLAGNDNTADADPDAAWSAALDTRYGDQT